MSTATNEYKAAAQTRKAIAIADALYDLAAASGISIRLEAVVSLDAKSREQAARAAGVRAPSDETWALVCFIVEKRGDCYPHRWGSEGVCLDCQLNPFARLS